MKALTIRTSISEIDLTTPTASKQYPLGTVFEFVDSDSPDAIKRFKYVKAHAALTQYRPYVISYAGTAASEILTAVPTTQTSPIVEVCVPQVAFTSGYYGFVQVMGQSTAKIDAETYASGDPLELINGGSTFIVNGTSGTPLVDSKTAAICQATGSSAANITVYLIGNRVQNASS